MKWLVRLAALYLVSLIILFTVVAVAGGGSTGPGAPSHDQMNSVSHSDYELHKSIGHVT
jgi:hypothetical protein